MATSAPFLFEGNPFWQRLFAGSAPAFLARACLPGVLLLVFGAWVGVDSIPVTYPDGHTENLGILWQANWSLMYVVGVPFLLYGTRLLSDRIERSISDLGEIEVIVPAAGHEGVSLIDEIRARFRRYARLIALLSLLATVVFLVGDTLPLVEWTRAQVAAMAEGRTCASMSVEMDWTTAFADRACWTGLELGADYEPAYLWANVAFNVYAYFLEGVWVFIALLCISKLSLFFFLMADFFGREEGQFRIEPLWDDPLRRLGLTSLGNIYNLMLTMLLLFEGYVVLHRLQRVALTQQISVSDYVRRLILAVDEPSRWLDPDVLQLSSIDVGTWFSILVIGPVVFMICWFPLFRIRNYIEERRIELTKEYALARKRAREAGDEAATDAFDRKARALDAANVWPNGDRAAWRFLFAMIALWIGSIVPMAFLVLATLMAVPEILSLVAELVTRVLRSQSRRSAFSDEA